MQESAQEPVLRVNTACDNRKDAGKRVKHSCIFSVMRYLTGVRKMRDVSL